MPIHNKPKRASNIILTEFIGKQIRIIESTDSQLLHLEGIIVDETKHLLVIARSDGNSSMDIGSTIRIPKKNMVFELRDGGQCYQINGKDIICAPEKRTKKLR